MDETFERQAKRKEKHQEHAAAARVRELMTKEERNK
jgi:hypothetical protein